MTFNDAMGMLLFGAVCWTLGWLVGYLHQKGWHT